MPSRTAPSPNARRKLGSAQTWSERPFPALSQLAAVAETAMTITRINSVFVGQIAPAPRVTQVTDSKAPALSPAPFFSLPPSFPSSVSCAHASCSVAHGIRQLQLPREQPSKLQTDRLPEQEKINVQLNTHIHTAFCKWPAAFRGSPVWGRGKLIHKSTGLQSVLQAGRGERRADGETTDREGLLLQLCPRATTRKGNPPL